MAKDPAFLFYSDNFQSGTQFFTDEQTGKYIRLICAQHQHGHLTEKQMLFICKEKDEMIWEKFKKDEDGKYYQERLENEIIKRKTFTESRRSNRNKLNNDSLHIYFIKNNDTGLIKIGSSVDVDRRFVELNKQHGGNLKLLFISEKCSQKKEKELHDLFEEKREFNEWYSLSREDLILIKTTHIKPHMTKHMSSHMGNGIGNENGNTNEAKNELVFPFDSQNFLKHWQIWKSYKKDQHRFTYKTPISEQAALNDLVNLAEGREERAIEIIMQSISKSWKGFFELKTNANGKSNSNNGSKNVSASSAFSKIDRMPG